MKNKKNTSNLIFSAFLVTAYVICAYFFIGLIKGSTALSTTVSSLLIALVFVIFGFILFYATRVGDGKQIKRFSLATLIILDLPALYIILASVAPGLPFPMNINNCIEIVYFAAVALGYGIPYTFLSGYEIESSEEDNDEISPEDAAKLYDTQSDDGGKDKTENSGNSEETEFDELEKLLSEKEAESDDSKENNDHTENNEAEE